MVELGHMNKKGIILTTIIVILLAAFLVWFFGIKKSTINLNLGNKEDVGEIPPSQEVNSLGSSISDEIDKNPVEKIPEINVFKEVEVNPYKQGYINPFE